MVKFRKPHIKPIPPLTPRQAQDLVLQIEKASINFKGLLDELESAVGMFMIGRLFGWKVLLLIHNKKTIRKYEEILGGISVRELFEPEGPLADKSVGLEVVKKLGNFWKAVSGELKIEGRRELSKA